MPPPQVLDRRVGVEDLRRVRADPRVRERSLARAAHRILQGRVGERECGDVVARSHRLRPALVQVDSRRAGDVREDGVEHLPILFVGVEPFVQEAAQKSSALRRAEAVGVTHRRGGIRLMLQPRGGIANRGEAEAGDWRVRRAVRDLVSRPRLEAAVERHGVTGEAPPRARNLAARRREELRTGGEAAVRAGRIDGVVARQIVDREFSRACVCRPLRADDAGDRGATIGRHRHADAHRQRPLGHIELPPDPDQRVAEPHQEPIAKIVVGRRVWRPAAIEAVQRDLVTAIEDVDERCAVSSRRLRPQDVQIGRELDAARGVDGGLVEVGDDLVVGILGVDGEMDRADDLLVARQAEVGTARDLDARHLRAERGRHEERRDEADGRQPAHDTGILAKKRAGAAEAPSCPWSSDEPG